ncbi:hypothetical protein Tco_0352672 [Tanacetum coccineum]
MYRECHRDIRWVAQHTLSKFAVIGIVKSLAPELSQISTWYSVKNWNDHFFWVDEFVVPANARFNWFSGSNIAKDRAPAPSEYNVEHINTLIAHASPFLRFPEEFLCWVGISRNYLLNKDMYPRFEYENGEGMDLNAFIRTTDPRKVRIVERPRAENEGPIVAVAKHRTVTLLRLRGHASVGGGGDQGFDSAVGQEIVGPSVPVAACDIISWRRGNGRDFAEEKNTLLEAKDKEIEDLKSQLLRARRGCPGMWSNSSAQLKVTGLSLAYCREEHKLSELERLLPSLMSQNQSLVESGSCLAFGGAIEKGIQEGLAAGLSDGQAVDACTDLEAFIVIHAYDGRTT